MIKKISEGNAYFWLTFHFALGIAAGINKYVAAAWIYVVIATAAISFLNGKKSHNEVIQYFFSYYVTFEVFGRMLGLTPLVPMESGKYLAVAFLLTALAFRAHNTRKFRVSTQGLAICLLSIPAIFLMSADGFWDDLVFNWFGIFSLGLFVIYFSNFTFGQDEITRMMRLMVYPLVSTAAYLTFNTPSLSQMHVTVGANWAGSGHFGPNQVSGTFGIGIFVITTSLILGNKLFKNKYIDVGILLFLTFRGILTFSRGGIFSAAIAIVPIYFLGTVNSKNASLRKLYTLVIVFVGIAVLFNYINRISGNTLKSRYEGQTLDVHMGDKESNLETVTDGRSVIIIGELGVFARHILLGVGPGQASKYWNVGFSTASHTEYTRLLAEHGIPGLVIDLILLWQLFYFWNNRRYFKKNGYAYYMNLALLVFALSMCAHSAMRTLVTPFFFGLAMAGIREGNKKKSFVAGRHLQEPVSEIVPQPV